MRDAVSAAPEFIPPGRPRPRAWLRGGTSLIAGAGITFALFSAMARFEHIETAREAESIEDLHVVSVPVEIPPPRQIERTELPSDAATPLANIQIGTSDSPVKIAVVPPELAMLYPPETTAPPAQVTVSTLYTDLKPRTQLAVETKRIYQQSEVDQAPTVLRRAVPRIPPWIRGNAEMLRVTLVIVADTTGAVASVRLIRPSGNDEVDELLTECVRTQWLFTPAIKSGKKVRCLFQQTITVKWTDATPFGY